MFIRGGRDDATVFENYLIEEQDVDGIGFASAMGFVSFLDDISQRVTEYMKWKPNDPLVFLYIQTQKFQLCQNFSHLRASCCNICLD